MACSRLLFSKCWNRLLLHSKHFAGSCFRNDSGQLSSLAQKRAIVGLFRRTVTSVPTLPIIVNRRNQIDVDILDVNVNHQEKPDSVQQALTRVDLDLRKHGRLNRENIECIVKEIKYHNRATSTQGLYLIQCCGNCLAEELPQNRNKLVKEMWELLSSIEVHLDISHFNALLLVYLENEYSFNPLRFLASIIELDIQPNRVTYQRLVAAYCQKGDLDGAAKILDIIKHKEMAIDAQVFNAIVMGHSVIGDWKSAKEILSAMSKNGLMPDAETYRELLCGYARHGVLTSITSSINECKKKDIVFSDEDLLAALYAAAVHGHSEIVDVLLSHMKKGISYNRACVHIILRLITQRKEDAAFKVLMSMKPPRIVDGRMTASGRFFIRHIVKSDCPSEKIISFCQELVQSGKHFRAFFTAIEAASRYEKTDLVNLLLNEIKSDKNNCRPHLLGPLLTSESQVGGEKNVLDMLRKMVAIRIFPNADTVKRHVLPHVTGDSQTLLNKLLSSRVSFFVIAVSLLQKSLESLDFDDAVRITSTFYVDLDASLRQAAVRAYLKSRNAIGLAKLIRSLLPEKQEEDDMECDSTDLGSELIGLILKEICEQTPKSEQLDRVKPFLEALRQQGLGISLSVAQFVRETLEITPPVSDLLAELCSGELIPVKLDPRPTPLQWANNAQVIKRKSEFCTFARERKLDEALASKKEMEARNIPFTDGMNLLLMDLYAHHGYLDEALDVFSQLFSHNPDLVVFPTKVMSLATHLLKGDRISDALGVLQKLKADPRTCESTELTNAVNGSAMRLMNTAAEKGDVQLIQKIFERLEESKSLKIGNAILGSLVKVHVIREDVESALNEFDRWTKQRRATPWNSDLAVRLIQKDDTKSLDRLFRMNSQVHGEMNSLYDLSLAFLRCDRVNQARKVLQTPGLRALNNRLNDVCAYYVRKKRIDELENIVKITKDLFNIDRNMLYDHLLSACIQADKPIRAVGVWTLMQEEGDVVPRDDFLRRLADFLTAKNTSIPFAVPGKPKT